MDSPLHNVLFEHVMRFLFFYSHQGKFLNRDFKMFKCKEETNLWIKLRGQINLNTLTGRRIKDSI